jgi:hypothetical protein
MRVSPIDLPSLRSTLLLEEREFLDCTPPKDGMCARAENESPLLGSPQQSAESPAHPTAVESRRNVFWPEKARSRCPQPPRESWQKMLH